MLQPKQLRLRRRRPVLRNPGFLVSHGPEEPCTTECGPTMPRLRRHLRGGGNPIRSSPRSWPTTAKPLSRAPQVPDASARSASRARRILDDLRRRMLMGVPHEYERSSKGTVEASATARGCSPAISRTRRTSTRTWASNMDVIKLSRRPPPSPACQGRGHRQLQPDQQGRLAAPDVPDHQPRRGRPRPRQETPGRARPRGDREPAQKFIATRRPGTTPSTTPSTSRSC